MPGTWMKMLSLCYLIPNVRCQRAETQKRLNYWPHIASLATEKHGHVDKLHKLFHFAFLQHFLKLQLLVCRWHEASLGTLERSLFFWCSPREASLCLLPRVDWSLLHWLITTHGEYTQLCRRRGQTVLFSVLILFFLLLLILFYVFSYKGFRICFCLLPSKKQYNLVQHSSCIDWPSIRTELAKDSLNHG